MWPTITGAERFDHRQAAERDGEAGGAARARADTGPKLAVSRLDALMR